MLCKFFCFSFCLDLYSLIKVPSQLEEGIDDRSQGNDLQIDGYHDAEHILTELTSPYRDFSPGSTGDTSFEHESSGERNYYQLLCKQSLNVSFLCL